jgi:large subunit ribosomal protein L24
MHVRRGDLVQVIAGNDAGKKGRVLRTIPEKGRVVVENVNMVHRHMRGASSTRRVVGSARRPRST